MAKTTRLLKSFSRLLLPVILLVTASLIGASVWLVYKTSEPPVASYLVTPDKYGRLSARGSQVTDETWQTNDGVSARGWLLRGIPNAPAVILLHRYGADRSHVLNLGVKLNEATNFTVLMPDMRAHGSDASVKNSTFGGCEGSDTTAAIAFLRSLKSPEQLTLVGRDIGIYGLEMGALAGVHAAAADQSVKALVLDSVPRSSDELLGNSVGARFPFASVVTAKIAQLGTYAYYYEGCYNREAACESAKQIADRRVMVLGGVDAPMFQDSSNRLSKCFPASTTVDSKTDLSPSGFSIMNASLEVTAAYDQRVIDFMKQALTLH
jgi:pimeloyl-ACP methyl ester carboxylesterase